MFERAIVASDFSKESLEFVETSGGLKGLGTKEILLMQFWGALDFLGVDSFYKPTIYEDFEKNLREQKAKLEKQGFKVRTRVLEGLSAAQVNNVAIEENYSLIAVASDREIFGSMANELIHNARKPTYIYKSRDIKAEEETPVSGVGDYALFATDFSKNSEIAFNYLIEMLPLIKKKVTVVHVQDEFRISPYLDDRIDEFNKVDAGRLEALKKILLEKGCPEAEALLRYGSPASEILKAVNEQSAQIVIMGSQGRGFVNEFLLGSVSHNIARRSPVPVLLIPAKR